MWIDSHCHLTHEKFKKAGLLPEDLVQRAHKAGVEGMLGISCGIHGDFTDVLSTAQRFNGVWCTIGTHPHNASKPEEIQVSRQELVSRAQSDPNIVGIGETGLDYYYNYAAKEDQEKVFRKHIQASLETDLPLVIHARDADDDIIRILKEESAGSKNLRGVMHCFSSGARMAEEALDLGFYISFSGIITFKSAKTLQDIAKTIPLERILVETDAPYLAPEPFRSKINEPAYVVHTGHKLADLHFLSEEEMANHCKNNFFSLFKGAQARYEKTPGAL